MDAIRFTLLFLTLLTIFANFDQFSVVSAVDVEIVVEEPVGNSLPVVDSDQGASGAALVKDQKNYECCIDIDQPFDLQQGTPSNTLRNRFAPTIQAVEPVQIVVDDSESNADPCPICLDDLKPVDLAACEALSNVSIPNNAILCPRRRKSLWKLYPKLLAASAAKPVPRFIIHHLISLWDRYSKSEDNQVNDDDEDETVYFHLPKSYNEANGGNGTRYEVMAKHRAHKKCVRSLITGSFPSVIQFKCPMCNSVCDCKDLWRQDAHFPSLGEIEQMLYVPKELGEFFEVIMRPILIFTANDVLLPFVENDWIRGTLMLIMALVFHFFMKHIFVRNF